MKTVIYRVPALVTLAVILSACGGGSDSTAVTNVNTAPTAIAGLDQRVKTTSLVSLDGSGSSDADGDGLSYSWSFTSLPAGSSAVLSDETSATPTFTADADGRYVLSLTVSDGTDTSTADTIEIAAATYDFGPMDQSLIDANTSCNAVSGTTISGGNIINQTWNAAGSPYIVQGDVTIPAGSTLTIEAGTTVCFASTDAMGSGVDTGKIEIINEGNLSVSGTSVAPVLFRSIDPSTGTQIWVGVATQAGAETSVDYAYFSNAATAVSGANGTTTVTHSVFMYNYNGMVVGYNSVVDASVFLKNSYAGLVVNGMSSLHNLLIYGNYRGIYLLSSYNGITMHYCTIDGNVYGIYAPSSGYNFTIYNAIITNNTYGIYASTTSGNAYIYFSDVWNNSTLYGSYIYQISGISSNPLFTDKAFDYSLSSGSPAIDSGTNDLSVATDLIGTARPQDGDGINGVAYDMGAYEAKGI